MNLHFKKKKKKEIPLNFFFKIKKKNTMFQGEGESLFIKDK